MKYIWRQDLSIIPKMAREVHLLVMLPTEKMSPKFYKLIWAHNHQNHSNTRLMDRQSTMRFHGHWDENSIEKTNMTHDEFPFHGFANHYQKKSRHDLPLFSAKKSSFHPVVDRVFFFTQINRDSRNTPVKLDNIQRPTSRRGRLQGGFKICHHTLWTHSCFGTTPPGWSQSSLVSPPKSVEDSMALVFGLLGIPPQKKRPTVGCFRNPAM